jgi:CHASE2 domain-containing sensor protein
MAARPLARRLLSFPRVRGLVIVSLLIAAAVMVVRAAQPAQPADCIVLDDFSQSKVGEFPVGWEARKD